MNRSLEDCLIADQSVGVSAKNTSHTKDPDAFLSLFVYVSSQIKYGQFMCGLSEENVQLNRKVLSEIAMQEPFSFKALVDLSRKYLRPAESLQQQRL